MTTVVTLSDARASLPALIDCVLAGQEITITRHGVAVAVVVRPDALRARRADSTLELASALHDVLEAARQRPLATRPRIALDRAELLVEGIRSERDR